MRFKQFGLLAASSVLALSAILPAKADTLIAQIYGIYDAENGIGDLPDSVLTNPNNPTHYTPSNDYDTPSLFFVNPTAYAITNAQMVLTVNPTVNGGWNTFNNTLTQTVMLGTIRANGITQVAWGTSNPGPLFNYDYDDNYSNNYGFNPFPGNTPGLQNPGSLNTDCTLNTIGGHPEWTNFCAPVGNFQVAFTGLLDGDPLQPVSALFGEFNVDGLYTGWEGIDPDGWSENLTYDVHTGTVSGILANICLGGVGENCSSPLSAVPEPFTLSLFGAGLAGAAAVRRRKKKSQQA